MSFLDPVLGPLLKLPPIWGILIVAVVISVVITFAYKWLTDQNEMKALKDDIKKIQEKMKEHKKDPEKMMKIQKQAMDKNMKYMMKSMKPTLFTFIPIILIFGWLNSHMAYYPLVENVPFTATLQFNDGVTGDATIVLPNGISFVMDNETKIINDASVTWTLTGPASPVAYSLSFKKGDLVFNKDIIITQSKEDRRYEAPNEIVKKNGLKNIVIGNEKIKGLNLFGWQLGWLGTYIIFSLIVSIGLRKLLKIY
ncbi:hypothetical protein COV93_07230 [Candidatus Woesearchaeota archaeon CG11_big_fil_rev_8_21_14_0_20_43_8]|nr:MAG: hypothetical protein COV93_07230 [Candidatus Woesearchaeota archaeon CG11_big_fil_rev_8_21_14_0_20_43_8]PIO08987.1 MAG: hypothetical protein COT47_00305 [Candidatus Woesearchaeota archaeon CG08_land_8_20_14_0_20_43_7]